MIRTSDVREVDEREVVVSSTNVIHQSLECLAGVTESEWYPLKLKQAKKVLPPR